MAASLAAHAELALIPEIAGTLGTALDFIETAGSSLVVDAGRMRSNLRAYGEGSTAHGMERSTDEILAGLAAYFT